jgi:hypothetical protein
MQRLGKLLVILNAALAIMFLMWAVAVYFEKVNWFTDTKAPAGAQTVGIVDKAQARIKDLNEGSKGAAKRWAGQYAQVAFWEQDRPRRRDFYRGALYMVETGKDPGWNLQQGLPPVQQLGTDANGVVIPQLTGKPIEGRPGVALDSIAGYDRRIADAAADIKKRQEAIVMLIEEHRKLSEEIIGTPEQKGLRTLIAEQEVIGKNALSELDYLAPFFTNRFSEHAITLRRVEAMEARKAELQKFAEARDLGR